MDPSHGTGPSRRRESNGGRPAGRANANAKEEELPRPFAKPASKPQADPSSRPGHSLAHSKPSSATKAHAPRKAVPPGYLHDLLHSRHLMKTVGLRKQMDSRNIPNPLAGVPVKTSRLKSHGVHARHGQYSQHGQYGQDGQHKHTIKHTRVSKAATPKLPELFQQRKLYLDRRKERRSKKRREERETNAPARTKKGTTVVSTADADHADDDINLLCLPEELLLKIVCYLTHEEAKPLFLVCKELSETLKNAIKFHFNYATPMAMASKAGAGLGAPFPASGDISPDPEDKAIMPMARRPQKKRAVTAYADVLGHLKKGGQRNVVTKEAPSGSTHSLAAPRALMFSTPQTTPTSLQQQLPALSGISSMISIPEAPTPVGNAKDRKENC